MNNISFNLGDALFGGSHWLRSMPSVGRLVSILLNNAIAIAGIILLILILFAGFNMLTAAGDAQKFQRAQQIITTGIIGFIVVIASYLIIVILDSIFKLRILG